MGGGRHMDAREIVLEVKNPSLKADDCSGRVLAGLTGKAWPYRRPKIEGGSEWA